MKKITKDCMKFNHESGTWMLNTAAHVLLLNICLVSETIVNLDLNR